MERFHPARVLQIALHYIVLHVTMMFFVWQVCQVRDILYFRCNGAIDLIFALYGRC